MKKTLFLPLIALMFTAFSCEKYDCKKECDEATYYYSEDYADSGVDFLGVPSQNLDVLYFAFFTEKDKTEKFKFVGKSNEDYVYHEGTFNKDDLAIHFYPEDGHVDYTGVFSQDGKTLTVSYPGVDDARTEITFIFKDTKKDCATKKDWKK